MLLYQAWVLALALALAQAQAQALTRALAPAQGQGHALKALEAGAGWHGGRAPTRTGIV
jgi:hypothetical protein